MKKNKKNKLENKSLDYPKMKGIYKIKNIDISRLILILYIVLTIIFTYPVTFTTDKIPGDGGDGYQYLWFLWWYNTALLNFSNPYYTDYIFYPTGVNLAFSAMSPFNTILSIPLQLIFDLTLTYNILWLISFIIAGYGTYLLVKYLTGDTRAAFISGLIFMFSPYHFAHALGHLNLTTIEWIPFYILYLFKVVNESRVRNAVYAAFFLLLVALSEYYYLIYLLTFTIIFFLYNVLVSNKNILKKDTIKRFSIMVILFGLIFLPFAYPLLKEITVSESDYMYAGGFTEYSADLLGFFTPTMFHPILAKYAAPIYNNFTGNGAENTVFIGYIVLFLALFTVLKIRTKEIRFWSLSAIIFFILTLGPVLHINGKLLDSIKLPYSIIMDIPIISIARVPSRWDVLVMLSLAILVGYGLHYLFKKDEYFNKISRRTLTIILICIILFEYLAIPYNMTSTKVPEFYYQLKNDSDNNYAILDVPNTVDFAANYMYYQTVHRKKLIGGYVSRLSPDAMTFTELSPFIGQLSYLSKDVIINNDTIDYGKSILNFYNVRYIILHENYMKKDEFDITNNLLQNISKEKKIYKDGLTVYTVEKMIPLKRFILLRDNWYSFRIGRSRIAQMSNNATILSYSPEIRDSDLYLGMISFYKPRLLQIYLNDELVYEKIIKASFDNVKLKLRLKDGENIIRLYFPDGCQRPIDIPELKSKDTRCLGMVLTSIVSS